MTNYVLIYSGGSGVGMDEEESAKIMAEWGEWYGKLGEAILGSTTRRILRRSHVPVMMVRMSEEES